MRSFFGKAAILVALTFLPFSSGFGQSENPVTFSRDSLQLMGILHLPENLDNKPPAVLMLHGFTGHKAETHFIYARLARKLAENGIAAFRFDFAGSADSQGEFADMTILTELQDARVALNFLRQQDQIDPDRIGLLGFSMGGCVAALLAGEHPEFRAIVLWSPVAHPQENLSRIVGNEKKEIAGKVIYDLHGFYIGQNFIDVLPDIHPLQAVADFRAPALVIQGTADQSVPPSAGKEFAEILQKNNPRSRHEAIENANHTFSTLEWTNRVIDLTTGWFRDYLLVK